MRYRDALEYLYSLRLFGTKLGLGNIREILRRLDRPEGDIDFYHVAGTNGKGSTCAFLSSLLGLAGFRVGCFTSPHLEDFRERIRVDGETIGKKDVSRLMERLVPVLDAVARTPGCAHPTYFEAVTALALCYFRERGVEAAAWEVGMGGRLDATNAVSPKVAVITTVAMDHAAYLGNDLESIAAEKAGIVKPGVPVVVGDLPPAADKVVADECRRLGAKLLRASSVFPRSEPEVVGSRNVFEVVFPDGLGMGLALRLLGRHQADNCTVALAAWWMGESGGKTPDRGRVARALEETVWPGRFEIVRRRGIEFIVDGAHNPAGARALSDVLNQYLRGRPHALILGVLADKDVDGIVRELVPGARPVRTVTVSGARGLSGEELARRCRAAAADSGEIIPCETLEQAIGDCYSGPDPVSTVVIAGSLRLAGAARGIITSRNRRGRE